MASLLLRNLGSRLLRRSLYLIDFLDLLNLLLMLLVARVLLVMCLLLRMRMMMLLVTWMSRMSLMGSMLLLVLMGQDRAMLHGLAHRGGKHHRWLVWLRRHLLP